MAVKQDDLSKENIQKQPPEVVCKKIFAKFTLAQVTKDTLTKNTLATPQNTFSIEHLLTAASEFLRVFHNGAFCWLKHLLKVIFSLVIFRDSQIIQILLDMKRVTRQKLKRQQLWNLTSYKSLGTSNVPKKNNVTRNGQ